MTRAFSLHTGQESRCALHQEVTLMLVSLLVLFCVYGVSLSTGGGCISPHTGQESRCALSLHHGWTFLLIKSYGFHNFVAWKRRWIMNIASALYCVVIHRYTECYTSVIHGVILPLLYTPVYSVSIRSVILTWITWG